MRYIGAAILISLSLTLARAADQGQPPSGALDLGQCYKSALKRSETIAISEESVVQAEEQFRQAWQSIPPKISLHGQLLWQDTSHVASQTSGFFKSPSPVGSIRLNLAPLTFYREFAAISAASSFIQQNEYTKRRAEQVLYLSVAQSFWAVVQIEDQIKITESQRSLTMDLIKELQGRERVGRSREAEVVAAQSQLAIVEASLEDLKRARVAAREVLTFITGLDKDIPLVDTAALPARPGDLKTYLEASRKRPDILAQQDAVDTARAGVAVARSGHFPQWSLQANYYDHTRTGVQEPITWDVLAMVDVPIFSWGQVQSSVRQALSVQRTAELMLQRLQRQTDTDVRSAWENLRASLNVFDLYDKSASLAERNYALQSRDYRRALVSNLEVLQALSTLYGARLTRTQGLYNVKLNDILLRLAVGDLQLPEVKP